MNTFTAVVACALSLGMSILPIAQSANQSERSMFRAFDRILSGHVRGTEQAILIATTLAAFLLSIVWVHFLLRRRPTLSLKTALLSGIGFAVGVVYAAAFLMLPVGRLTSGYALPASAALEAVAAAMIFGTTQALGSAPMLIVFGGALGAMNGYLISRLSV